MPSVHLSNQDDCDFDNESQHWIKELEEEKTYNKEDDSWYDAIGEIHEINSKDLPELGEIKIIQFIQFEELSNWKEESFEDVLEE